MTDHRPGEPFASWDGRRFTYNSICRATRGVRDHRPRRRRHRPRRPDLLDSPRPRSPPLGNTSADGRYILFQTDGEEVHRRHRRLSTSTCSIGTSTATGCRPVGDAVRPEPGHPADARGRPRRRPGDQPRGFQRGSHPKGAHTRYLAEGASNGFFQTSLGVANPGAATTVVIALPGRQRSAGPRGFPIPGRQARNLIADGRFSRRSRPSSIGSAVVADRVIIWGGGYGSRPRPQRRPRAPTWFLAEGATHGAFQLFYLLQNPMRRRPT